ncbi:MAG: hemerythrin domain-containing protein [Nitrososphaerota archaeon]|nr:hemerythrin domain-containing protein [Nitrososphaerota archaeon]
MVDEILAEHTPLINEWKNIEKITKDVKTEEPKTREEKYDFLKVLTDLFGMSHKFMSRFKVHEIREERFIFPEMSERGKESLVHRLLDDHRKIDELLEKMRRLLEDYRFEKISAKELAEQSLKIHKEVSSIVMEHVKIEDEEFPKLK